MNIFEMKQSRMPDKDDHDTDRAREGERLIKFLTLGKNIDALKGKTIQEVFSSEQEKRSLLNNLTPDEFIDLLSGINGILRDKEKEEWKIDGERVGLKGFLEKTVIVPRMSDKKPLLIETLAAAKKMNHESQSIHDIALMISSAINATHAFADANGRTSRFINFILANDMNKLSKQALTELLGTEGRYLLDFNPDNLDMPLLNLLNKEIFHGKRTLHYIDYKNYDYDNPQCNNEVNKDKLNQLIKKAQQDKIMELAICKFIKKNNLDKEYLIPDHKIANAFSIPFKDMIEKISTQQIRNIIELYWQLKKRYVEILIDIIANPKKQAYKIKHNGKIISLKEYYEFELNNNPLLNKNFDKKLNKKNKIPTL